MNQSNTNNTNSNEFIQIQKNTFELINFIYNYIQASIREYK